MRPQTSPELRRSFFELHQAGMTYAEVARLHRVSVGCVRYWCRRQRDDGSCYTIYAKRSPASATRFNPRVRYVILRLRLRHPGWGPGRIHYHLSRRPSLHGMQTPSIATIGRYLKRWPTLRRPARPKAMVRQPSPVQRVHQRWQMDFKLRIPLRDGTRCNLFTVYDPFSHACVGGYLISTTKHGTQTGKISWEQARMVLRTCFAHWHTYPEELQTDGEAALVTQAHDPFPSTFTLWLVGLGIEHRVIRPRRPTDNAGVERCHRTIFEYAILGNEHLSLPELQASLSVAIDELVAELPSRARGCGGQPPLRAHPELLQPGRICQPEHELAQFDLRRVDAYLASLNWERRVDRQGRITLGGEHKRYKVDPRLAGHVVNVRFDPRDRHFVFYDIDDPATPVGRQPAPYITVERILGLPDPSPLGLGPQQLPLPLPFPEGVSC